MHLEGKVELQANISKTGTITGVKQLSGDAILDAPPSKQCSSGNINPIF